MAKYKYTTCDEIGGVGLDCKKESCKHHSFLGCHGADDPMNQTACRLQLNEFNECINNNFSKFEPIE